MLVSSSYFCPLLGFAAFCAPGTPSSIRLAALAATDRRAMRAAGYAQCPRPLLGQRQLPKPNPTRRAKKQAFRHPAEGR